MNWISDFKLKLATKVLIIANLAKIYESSKKLNVKGIVPMPSLAHNLREKKINGI
jgi:hypothetical protein